VWVFLVGFLHGCTQKNPLGFFGYVPGCLNPANNSNHSYVRNVLHIKLVKLQSIWKSSSGWICHSKSGEIRLWPDWKK